MAWPIALKMDEAPESTMTQRLSNRQSVSISPDARNPVYACVRSCYYLRG
jgi:hypothetical protein